MKTRTAFMSFAIWIVAFHCHAVTIAQWTFETSQPTTAGPISPEIGNGSATGAGLGTISTPAGNGSAHSFNGNSWEIDDYWQFQVNTLGFEDISISWDQAGSGTGPRDFKLQYSINGTTFLDFVDYSVPSITWSTGGSRISASTVSPNLSAVALIEDASSVYFRLTDRSTTSINGGTVGSGGTSRIDNFTVSGSVKASVPDPGTTASLLGISLSGLLLLRRVSARVSTRGAAR